MSQRHTLEPLKLPLAGSHLIEASAGTGKTFTIALLYVRLVLGQPKLSNAELATGLLPQNLLVVTFTEAATKELRERIRKRLTQAAEVFAGTVERNSDNDILFELREQFDEFEYKTQQAKLLLAAEWMDEAAISTIHGWCYQMLQEHAFDSGNLFSQTLVTSIKELQLAALRDYYRTEVYPLNGASADRYLGLYPAPETLFKKVKGLGGGLDSDSQSLNEILINFEQEFSTELRRLKALPWSDWYDEIPDLLQSFNKLYKLNGTSKNSMVKAWDKLLDWAENDELFPEGFATSKGFQNQRPERLREMMAEPPAEVDHQAFVAIDQLHQLLAKLNNLTEPLLKHASDWLNKRVSAQMRKRAELGFNDLLDNLHAALHGPRGEHLARQIRQQFPAGLIDEFQDTDQTQYEIFDRIYGVADNDQNSCFVMIGDPKQAIYGFRGADIFTYLNARNSVAGRIHTLGRNFRSHQRVVDAVNRLFLHADKMPKGAFLFGSGEASDLPFEKMAANGTQKNFYVDRKSQTPLTFWSFDPLEGKKGKFTKLQSAETRKLLGAVCASQIVELLTNSKSGFSKAPDDPEFKRVQPGDIAILVNKRAEADAVRAALAERQVKSVYLSDRNSVLLSKQAQELLHWIRAFAEPRRLDLLRAALGTASVALTHAELEAINSDELELGRVLEQFEEYQRQWQRNGIYATLRRFLNDYQVPAKLLANESERALTDILHLGELLQSESMQLDGEHALIRQYEAMLLCADEESEHLNMRLESDANLVQVVTVHKSKGLEYPLVFLPFGTSLRSEKKSTDHVRYHDSENRWVTRFNPTEAELEAADRERLAEDMRKLYVALTRAKYAMWVGAAATENWHISALGYALGLSESPGSQISPALAQLADDDLIKLICEPEAGEQTYNDSDEIELGSALAAKQKLEQNWWIASYSRIQYEATSLGDIDDPSAEKRADEHEPEAEQRPALTKLEGFHGFVKGAGPGDFLHSILEWCCEQGFNRIDEESLRTEVKRRCESKNSPDYDPTLVTEWIQALISRPFTLPNGDSCSLGELEHAKAEMEFWFEVNELKVVELDQLINRLAPTPLPRPAAKELEFNGMLKGFIDLTFEHQGRYYVLDYKSTFLGADDSAYSQNKMQLKTLEKRYDLQYMIYTLALHRYLRSRLPDYDYDQHVGGALVMYLRGINSETSGILADRPPKSLIEQIDRLFAGAAL